MFKSSGFSLIEILISMTLASLILTLSLRHYIISKQNNIYTYRAINQSYDMQILTELMRNSIRRAGFTPCIPINWLITAQNGSAPLLAITLNADNKKSLQISRMNDDYSIVQKVISPKQMLLKNKNHFSKNTNILIADCMHAELKKIIKIERYHNSYLLTLDKPTHFFYIDPIYVGSWIVESFYIQQNKLGNNVLYYKTNRADELSDYIE